MQYDKGHLEAGWRRQTFGAPYLLGMLRRQIVLLLGVPILCVLAGFTYIVVATPTYTAEAFLRVDVDGGELDQLDAVLVSHMTSIRLPHVTAEVVGQLDLDAQLPTSLGRLDTIVGNLRDRIGLETSMELSEDERRTILEDQVVSGLTVQRVGESTILRVAYTAMTPRRAAEIADAYATTYVGWLVQRSLGISERRAEALQARAEEARRQATASLQEVQKIRSDRLEQGGFENLDAHLAQLMQTRSELFEAETATEARLSLLQSSGDDGSLEAAALQAEGGSELFDAYQEASSVLADIRKRGTPLASIAQLEGSVAQLREDLEQSIERARRTLKQDLVILAAQRDSIERALEDALFRSSQGNWSERLTEEYQAQVFQNIYADYLRELQNVYDRAGVVPVRVMTSARPRFDPSAPDYKLVLVLSAVLGLLLGGAIAMLREWLRSQSTLVLDHARRRPT